MGWAFSGRVVARHGQLLAERGPVEARPDRLELLSTT